MVVAFRGLSSCMLHLEHRLDQEALRVAVVSAKCQHFADGKYPQKSSLPESHDRSALSCRFDSCRLPGSDRSPVGTWQDRVPHIPPHLSCVAGRNRSTRGRTAETHATRARFHHNGPVWKCLGLGKTQSQSAHRATPLEKVCQPTGFRSINKGNCVAVPLIGQFWTVAASVQWPVTL